MRKLIVAEFVSLDGVIQAPGGVDEDTDGGFKHGAWTMPYWHDDMGAHFFQSMQNCDTLLLGRRTWQGHAGAFEPMADGADAFVDVMNGLRKYVVTNTLKSAAGWRNSEIIRGDDKLAERVRKLKAEPGKEIHIDGSSQLIHSLVPHGLIDEYSLLVYPVVLGSGKRLFPEGSRVNLKLVESKTYPTGVTLMRYVPAESA